MGTCLIFFVYSSMLQDTLRNQTQPSEEDAIGVGLFLWEIVKMCILALIIIIPIRTFFFQPFFVQGSSMAPNFEDGQYLIINEMGYKQTDIDILGLHFFSVVPSLELQRQESAVFHPPVTGVADQFFIKRVIGLPGELVEIKKGHIIIHNTFHPEGFVLDESSYLKSTMLTLVANSEASFSIKLKDDEYFMMGDNRLYSHDSRTFGPVKKNGIVGRVLVRAWPLTTMQVY
jgi:signal peptidase I